MHSASIITTIEEDRISMLPDELINHILSFVDTRYAVQTCVLSKRWMDVWKYLPFLNFDTNCYTSEVNKSERFRDFIEGVFLFRDDCSIQSFRMTSYSHIVSPFSVNRWIDVAVKRNVQEVTLEIVDHEDFDMTYEISPRLLNCKSLKKLTLRVHCEKPSQNADVIFPKTMSLPQLKFMCLDGFIVYDLESSKRLFSSCPLLETLNIVDCDIQTNDNRWNFYVESISLKQFAYNYRYTFPVPKIIKLSAPNLSFEFYLKEDVHLQHYTDKLSDVKFNILGIEYKNTDRPTEVREVYARRLVKLLAAVDKVIRLDLSPGFLEDLSTATGLGNCQLPCFCNLQSLRLETWFTRDSLHAIAYLLKISPNIETLILKSNKDKSNLADVGDDWEVGLSFPDMLCHLNLVRIYNAKGCDAELKILSFLLKNAKVLEQVALYPCSSVATPCRFRKQFSSSKSFFTYQYNVGRKEKYPHVVD